MRKIKILIVKESSDKKNFKGKKDVEDRKNNVNLINDRIYGKNSKSSNENYLNYDYNNVNINYNHHNYHIQKKYNQQKKIKQ